MKRTNKLKILGVTIGAVATGMLAMSSTNYTLTEALNLLASAGQSPSGHTATEAANLLVAQQAATLAANAPRDSLVGMFCVVYDDCTKEQWDSVRVFNPTKGGPGTAGGRTWDFAAGISTDAHLILYGDSVNTSLNAARVQALQRRGWDFGTVGYWEGQVRGASSIWNSRGIIGTGAFTSTNIFENQFSMARARATLDSMGITAPPRWISWSNSSGTAFQKAIASRLGYEFGFQSAQSASGQGIRPNQSWPLYQFSGADTLMANSAALSAVPGWNSDRFEILQCLGENNTSRQTKLAIWRAIQTKGLCVVILHRASAWKASLSAAGDTLGWAPTLPNGLGGNIPQGNLGSMSGVMSFCNRYVKAGLLRVVTPAQAADWYFNRPISPGANWINSNFRDVDRSMHTAPTTQYRQDNWMSFTGSSSLVSAPTPKALLSNPTAGGYGGKNYCKMNWVTASRSVWARGSARPWHQNNTDAWVIPPKGGGWTAHFEIYAIQDTTVASGSTANGDSLGVLFTVAKFDNWNAYSTGATSSIFPMIQSNGKDLYIPGGSSTGPFTTSNFFDAGANQFGNVFTFNLYNNINTRSGTRVAKWLHTVTDWEYPADADILFISVWHGTNNASGEIRLSNPHLSFFKNNPESAGN